MLTCHVESLYQGLEELKPLLIGHYDELSEHGKRGHKLNPDYLQYLQAENEGKLLYVTLRDNGTLVGYFVGFITRCLHYQVPTLSLDIVYVTPEARGQAGGVKIMQKIKSEFERRGIKLWRMGLKEAHREHMEKLLLSFGFTPFETHYSLWA